MYKGHIGLVVLLSQMGAKYQNVCVYKCVCVMLGFLVTMSGRGGVPGLS